MRSAYPLSRRLFMAMPLALAACKSGRQVIELIGYTMGTTYRVVAVDDSNLLDKREVQEGITLALGEVNQALSNWDESSEISRFNASAAGESQAMSPDLARVMAAADDVNRASAGRFDTTIGPLIELWGFGAPGTQAMPARGAVAAAKARSGHGQTLRLTAGALEKRQDSAQVYLAGIGKGYGADRVGQVLTQMGIKDYMIEIGGDLYAAGRNPDRLPWQIGVETPNAQDRSTMGVVGISNLGMASSGDYRNFFEADGQRYSHLIDPTTGRPVDHATGAATVLAENAMLADAWSTAMLILGSEQGLEIAQANDIAVQFIDRDGGAFRTRTSPRFAALTS